MNKRQVIALWIIAAVLGTAVGIIKYNQSGETKSSTQRTPGQTLFETFPANEVAAVEISGASGKINLIRKDGRWIITERDGYPANSGYVNDFIRTLAELKVARATEAGPSFAPRFGMDESAVTAEDRGLSATFRDASGKELAKISLGKNIQSGADAGPYGGGSVGRYIRNHADESGFYAISELFPAVTDEVVRWLDDSFFSPEKIQSISLSGKGTEETVWKLVRETEEAEFKLDAAKSGEVLNTTAAAPLKNIFSYARFDDVVPAAEVEQRTNVAEKRTATIVTFEGFTYQIAITPSKPAGKEDAPAATDKMLLTVSVDAQLPKERKKETDEKPEDAKTKDEAFTTRLNSLTEKLAKEKQLSGKTFVVAKSTVEPLLKERPDLIVKAEAAPAPNPAQGSVRKLPGGIVTTPPISIPPSPDQKSE